MSKSRNPRYLRIYLQDHHAVFVAVRALLDRMLVSSVDTPIEGLLQSLQVETEKEAAVLAAIQEQLGAPASSFKNRLARLVTHLGKVKLNGHLLTHSPLSRVIELERLRAAVGLKRCLWRSLGAIAPHEPALAGLDAEALVQQAEEQLQRIDHWHCWAAEQIAPLPSPGPHTPPMPEAGPPTTDPSA